MAPDLPFALPNIHWQTWFIPVAGLVSAGLALVMGKVLLRRQGPSSGANESKACVDPFVHGSAKERRTSLRRTGKYIKVLVSDASADTPPEQAYIVDRSLGGICFTFSRDLPENCQLKIRSVDASVGSPWVEVQVKRSERKGELDWEIGCQFMSAPTWASLLQFG
jgi:hypothetical protein